MTVSLMPVMEMREWEPSLLCTETSDFFPGLGGWNWMGSMSDEISDEMFGQVCEPSLVTYMVPETYGVFTPRIDVRETKKEFKIVSEIPGLDQKDINVSIREGLLTISGEKMEEKGETEGEYYHAERMFGRFSRRVCLPDTVDVDHVKSVYKNGLLTITLPKNEKLIQEKKIPITT